MCHTSVVFCLRIACIAAYVQVSDSQDASKPKPTADAILDQLDQAAPKPQAIPPVHEQESDVASNAARLWPEDYRLPHARGQISSIDGQWHFVFTDEEKYAGHGSIRVLPNSKLSKMETYVSASSGSVEFSIVGDVTVFQKQNYLLVRDVTILRNRPTQEEQDLAGSSDESEDQGGANDVLNALTGAAGQRRRIRTPSAEPIVSADATRESHAAWPEDTRLDNRIGRLVKEIDWWTYAFESSSELPGDAPVRILPNMALQRLVDYTSGGVRSAVFSVTGDITEYKGLNYILIRRLKIKQSNGNLQ